MQLMAIATEITNSIPAPGDMHSIKIVIDLHLQQVFYGGIPVASANKTYQNVDENELYSPDNPLINTHIIPPVVILKQEVIVDQLFFCFFRHSFKRIHCALQFSL